ncbi:ATP-binding protein [Kribbella solani]|uniref:Non-specific serine/threonine protein kinase n=1 Tax=Kribbella solani TaxID=236067 RepID=A0A841DJW8_9ACTN|nr:LuxR C-terminal-related transcriptional regulator [Kribbella solani]MBB5977375.1 non-specific serine/threonine protein kinase [Kribbella solani]
MSTGDGRDPAEQRDTTAVYWANGVCPPTPLVGRDHDRAELRRIIQSPARLVTLTGPGGAGKTRLAQAVVKDVRAAFRDGAWPVELAALSESGQVPSAVTTACPAELQRDPGTADTIRERLRDREVLLVLDNCEHVATGVTDLLAGLLSYCPSLRVLTTSRQPLQIYGERLYPVRPLPLPDSRRMPFAKLADTPSIALFVQRARAVTPDFKLTDDNVGDVAEICRLVDGLPLAIELAATKLRLFAPAALLTRLRDGIDILRFDLANVPPRQQSMRAAIHWSYQLLSPRERHLLTSLGVFADGFSLAAAAAVAQVTRNLGEELLESLLDKGLLSVSPDPDGEPRFHQLGTIQAFCIEQLQDTIDEHEVRDRHAVYFLQLVADAEQELGDGRHAAYLRRLMPEQANVLAAYRHLRFRGDADSALALATWLSRFMFSQGELGAGLQMLKETLADHSTRTGHRRHADALHSAGALAMAAGEYALAEDYQRAAVAAYHKLGLAFGEAAALNHLGNIARIRGDLRAARTLCEQSLSMWRAAEAPGAAARALIDLAVISLSHGDVPAADEAVDFALPLLEAHGADQNVRALAGLIAFRRGDHREAERICRSAVAASVEQGTHPETPFALEALALVLSGHRRPASDLTAVRLIAAANSIRAGTQSYACAQVLSYVDRTLQHLRQRLGQVAFDNACIAGRSLPLPTLLDKDAGLLNSYVDPADSFEDTILTAREREVVVLVAEGLTNRQIANRLRIAEWTAINHVRNVMRKLGLPSRVHVAQWATQRHLAP